MSGSRLLGKIAVITGASSGIGRGVAERFAEEGAKLVLVDRNKEGLTEVAELLRSRGASVVNVPGDVSLSATADRIREAGVEAFGGIDVLFNNAGIMPVAPLLEYAEEDWDQVIDINLKAMFLLSKKLIPEMLKRGGGSIINTSSVMSTLTEPHYTGYTSSKAGIIGLTKAIAVEFAEQGIRCNAICPGWVDTEMNRQLAVQLGGMDKLYPIIKQQQPTGKMATVREIANVVLFLASDESTAVTGASIFADGAASAAI
ncbi:SDR family NAD(P)-dependent oxidoreductase [Paenibacillus sp. BC26]|uniref:SDR family NAD(P)-dependent oxidoreductase n=1 Tax=Paenibacillus sp. BC26 TaxID=1881032 RepID=UPI0008E19A25|nr:SDR family oxidoreductase [Paenibacillus sp. BC26]SFS66576.1 NAD(P)-dependent dehydrogenase, short-chain alcohol dehydrogenase family [Paenibacillus sp. BC26]